MDSVNIKNFNTLKTMDKIFSIPPGPKHIVEAANYLYGTENEVGSKINETSAYNYFSGTDHILWPKYFIQHLICCISYAEDTHMICFIRLY